MDEPVSVVLAAGRGRRLGSLGETYVKALLPVANEPVIAHHLRLLRALGIRRVIVVVGHHAGDLEAALGDGARYGLHLTYVAQPAPLGSAHALASVRSLVQTPFLLILGDYYFVATDPAVMMHRLRRGESAIATKRETSPTLVREACAVYTGHEGIVLDIVEKPTDPRTEIKGCGFYALQPEFFDAVCRTPRTALRDEYELTVSLELFVRAGHQLFAEEIIDWDSNITRPRDLLQCNLEWLDRNRLSALVSAEAFVDPSTTVDRTVVGHSARVLGRNALSRVVVFPGTELTDAGALEHTLLTPYGAIPCGDLSPGNPATVSTQRAYPAPVTAKYSSRSIRGGADGGM
jgi:dTDP-glucose pyrophosphorylase